MSIKSRIKMSKINKMNEGNLLYANRKDLFHIQSDKSIDDIKVTDDLEVVPRLYDDGKGMQAVIRDKETKETFAILNCLKPHEMLEKLDRELKRKEKEREQEEKETEERRKIEAEEKEKRNKKSEEKNKEYYDRYVDFLLENNANPEIIGLKAVKDIMLEAIKSFNGRPRAEGGQPFVYHPEVREDGTFKMRARTDGPTASIEYDIEYSDEDDSYLKITKADVINDFSDVPDRSKDKTEIYVDKEGNITKKRKVLRDLEEEERQYNEMLRRVEEENEKVRQKSIDMLKKHEQEKQEMFDELEDNIDTTMEQHKSK